MSPPSTRRSFEFFLLAALGAALYLSNSYFTFIDDEVLIISAAAAPVRETLHAFWIGAGQHQHPPLYDLLLHFWLALTRGAMPALRLPAIVCYLCGLWLIVRAADKLGGAPAGRAVLFLGIFWPYGFHYGRIAAWYSFCFLIVAGLTLAYLKFVEQPSKARWVALMALACALIYTNYFGWAMLGCLAFDFVARNRDRILPSARVAAASGFVLAVIYLPLWRAFVNELRRGPQFIHSPLTAVLNGGFQLYNTFVSEAIAPWVLPLGIPAFLCVAACVALVLRHAPREARRFLIYALVLMGVLTALGLIGAKRLLPVAAWVLLPTGAAWSRMPRGRAHTALSAALAGILLLGWFGIFSRRYYSAPRMIEPWREVAAETANRARSGAEVIGNNPSFFFYLTYELHPPGSPGGWEMLRTFTAPGVFDANLWIERGRPLNNQVVLVLGAPGPAADPAAWGSVVWLNGHCRLASQKNYLPDPASHFKAKFMPELGELPWRIQSWDYSCPAEMLPATSQGN